MAENTAPAMCSEAVYQAARAAGLLIVTTDEEAAVQKFADAIYAMGYSDAINFVATGERRTSREDAEDARAIAAEARWMERNEQDGVPYGTY